MKTYRCYVQILMTGEGPDSVENGLRGALDNFIGDDLLEFEITQVELAHDDAPEGGA